MLKVLSLKFQISVKKTYWIYMIVNWSIWSWKSSFKTIFVTQNYKVEDENGEEGGGDFDPVFNTMTSITLQNTSDI